MCLLFSGLARGQPPCKDDVSGHASLGPHLLHRRVCRRGPVEIGEHLSKPPWKPILVEVGNVNIGVLEPGVKHQPAVSHLDAPYRSSRKS